MARYSKFGIIIYLNSHNLSKKYRVLLVHDFWKVMPMQTDHFPQETTVDWRDQLNVLRGRKLIDGTHPKWGEAERATLIKQRIQEDLDQLMEAMKSGHKTMEVDRGMDHGTGSGIQIIPQVPVLAVQEETEFGNESEKIRNELSTLRKESEIALKHQEELNSHREQMEAEWRRLQNEKELSKEATQARNHSDCSSNEFSI